MNPISFLVITHRKGELLQRTLNGLSAQTQFEAGDEIIVVDDGGYDAAVVALWPRVRYVAVAHDGYRLSLMCNLGILTAGNDRIVKMDGDCIPQEYFVDVWRECMADTGVWGGRIDWQKQDGSISVDFRLNANTLAPLPWFVAESSRGKQIYGGNMAFFRDDAIRVGGFYDGFHFGWGAEDGDFARKLHDAGIEATYNWDAKVVHQFHHPTAPHERCQTNRDLFNRRLRDKIMDPPLSLDVARFAEEKHPTSL